MPGSRLQSSSSCYCPWNGRIHQLRLLSETEGVPSSSAPEAVVQGREGAHLEQADSCTQHLRCFSEVQLMILCV